MNFFDQNSAPAISGNLANYTFRTYQRFCVCDLKVKHLFQFPTALSPTPGKIVWLLSPASWRLWACFNSLSDFSLATGMNKPIPGKIVWLLSPASWRLWACFNSLSDSSLATGMNKPI